MAALVIIIFFIPYTASGFSACGKLFSTLFGMDYLTAMLISAAVIVIYTVMGGFLAASFTDLIQSIIMTVALVVVLGFGVTQAGGVEAVLDNARSLTELPVPDPHPRPRHRRFRALRPADHLFPVGLGPGIFRHAPHSGPLHGH